MKQKCFLIATIGLFLFSFTINQNQYNSRPFENIKKSKEIANDKGFDIDSNFVYIDDHEDNEYKELKNGSRFYGKYSMWIATYKYLNTNSDTMYYLCLAETTIEPNQNSYWDIRGWYNQRISLKTEVSLDNARKLVYSPEAFEQDTTKTWGISLSVSSSVSAEVIQGSVETSIEKGITASYTETVTYPSISASISTTGTKKNNLTITYNFNRYKKNDKKDCSHSHVQKKYMILYYIENFKSYVDKDIYINYSYTPTIYRNGVINCTSLSAKEPLIYSTKVN